MNIDKVPAGKNPPQDINVIIEITGGAAGGAPVKYEIDKESGAVFVDRVVNTPMFYPCNYGFVPNSLHADGDPTDVLVICDFPLQPGVVIRCRPVGVLKMEDDGGMDDKLIAVPIAKVDPFQAHIKRPRRHPREDPRPHQALLRALQGSRGGQVGEGHRLGRPGRGRGDPVRLDRSPRRQGLTRTQRPIDGPLPPRHARRAPRRGLSATAPARDAGRGAQLSLTLKEMRLTLAGRKPGAFARPARPTQDAARTHA
jgi:inorganic pyrophosphatase